MTNAYIQQIGWKLFFFVCRQDLEYFLVGNWGLLNRFGWFLINTKTKLKYHQNIIFKALSMMKCNNFFLWIFHWINFLHFYIHMKLKMNRNYSSRHRSNIKSQEWRRKNQKKRTVLILNSFRTIIIFSHFS